MYCWAITVVPSVDIAQDIAVRNSSTSIAHVATDRAQSISRFLAVGAIATQAALLSLVGLSSVALLLANIVCLPAGIAPLALTILGLRLPAIHGVKLVAQPLYLIQHSGLISGLRTSF